MRLMLVAVPLFLLFRTSFAQTADNPPSFEVASVKPAPAPIATKDEYTEGYNAGMRAALASAECASPASESILPTTLSGT
ncbi:MAG: hypothetical protein WDO73_31915 [Ignavibacteriota bacterium]